MSGYKQVMLPVLVDSNGSVIGFKELDGDETMIPRYSTDMTALLKPDGTALNGTGVAYVLPVATSTVLGGVKAGSGVSIAGDGTINAAGGGGGGSAADDIAFTTTVPLLNTAGTYMTGIQSVSGPLTFTPAAGAVRGAFTTMALKANGANVPDVSAFTEHVSSAGYLNTANILNLGQFFNLYGTNYVSWSQALTPVAIVAPTAVTLSGPSSGIINTASSNFTVGTDGVRSAAVVVTPTPITGVTFSPTSVTLPAGTATGTFTATSTTTGAKSVAVTNNAGLTNPTAITWTVAAAATAPATMAAPTAAAGDTTASVAMVAPSDGGSPITGYTVTSSPAGMTDSNAGSTSLTHTMTGGVNGTAYTFTARATNTVGTSTASSPSNSVTLAASAPAAGRLNQLVAVVESGSGPYTYTGNDALHFTPGTPGPGGVVTTAFQNGIDGYVSFISGNVAQVYNEIILGVMPGSSLVSFDALPYSLYVQVGAPPSSYRIITNGTISTGNGAAMNWAAGDVWRARRVGTSLILEVARSATPTAFTAIHTYTGVSSGVLRAQVMLSGTTNATGLTTFGFA